MQTEIPLSSKRDQHAYSINNPGMLLSSLVIFLVIVYILDIFLLITPEWRDLLDNVGVAGPFGIVMELVVAVRGVLQNRFYNWSEDLDYLYSITFLLQALYIITLMGIWSLKKLAVYLYIVLVLSLIL